MAKVVFMNAIEHKAEIRDVPDDFRAIQRELGCDIYSIIGRRIGGRKVYDIYHDDNFLFMPRTRIKTGMCENYDEDLYENIFIARHTPSGALKGLTDEEVEEVLNNVKNGVLRYKV